jgi:hypothetical protein
VGKFAVDSALEESGFEPLVPLNEDSNSPTHPERQRSEDRRKQVWSRDGMMFLAGWLAAALGLALVAMQGPAATREYKAALWFGATLANLLGCCRDL